MKELLEKVVAIAPTYISDLLSLVPGPKVFVAERVSREPSPIRDALLFLTISFLLGWIIKTSYLRGDPLIELATDATFVLFQVLLFGAALCFAWRVVKGHAQLQKMFVIHFYYAGVLLLIFAIWFMALSGILRAIDPSFYTDWLDAIYHGDMLRFILGNKQRYSQSPSFSPSNFTWLLGFLISIVWLFAGWGAYRQLNQVSRLRSALAATLFVSLWMPIEALLFLIANAALR